MKRERKNKRNYGGVYHYVDWPKIKKLVGGGFWLGLAIVPMVYLT